MFIADFIVWIACFCVRPSDALAKAYYFDELPRDYECDDIANKYKWRHLYRVRGQNA